MHGTSPLTRSCTSPARALAPTRSVASELRAFRSSTPTQRKVIASALFNLGEEVTENPHGVGISPDGKWLYIGEMHRVAATRQVRSVLMVINARTLKLDRLLQGPRADWFHHITAFTDWQGRDRVIVGFGRNAGGGPIYLLDPKDNNRVVKSFTLEDIGYRIGHPYPTVDPTGRFLYMAVFAPPWRGQNHNTAGIAKVNLETNAVTIIPFVGDNPIGMAHTSDGRFTFVNDAESSDVYKIDNQTNRVVEDTSAGVAGPYGLALNWDESVLYPIGKGEGTHNNGSVVGYVTTAPSNRPATSSRTCRSGSAVRLPPSITESSTRTPPSTSSGSAT